MKRKEEAQTKTIRRLPFTIIYSSRRIQLAVVRLHSDSLDTLQWDRICIFTCK